MSISNFLFGDSYEVCVKGNASYVIMLAHDVRGRCWCYSSSGWTFPSVFHYILLLCDRWHQRGSLTKWRLTWKCVWSKGLSLNSSMRKKLYPLTFIDTSWTFVETKQSVWKHWGSGWCVSAVATVTWKISHTAGCHAQLLRHKMKSISISLCAQIS